MKTIKKERSVFNWKTLLMLFVLNSIISFTSIQSQTTSNTNNEPSWFDDERPIKYRSLNELAKYVDFKRQAIEHEQVLKREIAIQDSIIVAQAEKIRLLEEEAIPLLKDQITDWERKYESQTTLTNLTEQEYIVKLKALSQRRFVIGPSITYGFVPGMIDNKGTAIGLSFTYALIRF